MSLPPEGTRSGFSADRIRRVIERVNIRQSGSAGSTDHYRFGPLVLGIRIRQGGLTSLTAMISHRRICNATTTAHLDVLDGPDADLEPLVPSAHDGPDRFVLSSDTAYCLWEPQAGGKLTAVDRINAVGVVWYRSPETLPSWDMARPFLHAFKGLSPFTGLIPVHAASVARGDKGLLIAGRGGAGKTSLALACVEAGWRYVGDDFVLIGGTPPRATNLYRSALVREDMFVRLNYSMAGLMTVSADSGEVKAQVDVGRLPSSSIGDAAVAAVVVPRRSGASTIIVAPLRQSAVLRELSMTTRIVLPGDPMGSYDAIAQIIANTPCYAVDPGPVLGLVPTGLEDLLGNT